ncbi:MAG: 8-amino-7-oxononanoate synthase [Bacteroidetes bacterium]|nr:8-amino-7-oxononanoate synthase [Bacteroidota bacterium]
MKERLKKLEEQGCLRSLKCTQSEGKYIIYDGCKYLNFSSNDYLGLTDIALQTQFFGDIDNQKEFLLSNPSSRLMTGNNIHYEELENSISSLFKRPACLVLSCGYMLNSGVLPALTSEKDLIIADKLVHASIIDGLRLCKCRWKRYRHNNMADLRRIIESEKVEGTIYIVTESIFSMDGDIAPLKELVALKEEFGAKLYVDEAHAFGVRGDNGCGIAEECGVVEKIDYIVATLGKAMASQGAFIVCDTLSRNFLINKMRTLIFSTAMPSISLMWSKFLIDKLPEFADRRGKLAENIAYLSELGFPSDSHIVPVMVGDAQKVVQIVENLKKEGIWAMAVRHPTVPKGTERLRLSITSSFSSQDLNFLAQNVKSKL